MALVLASHGTSDAAGRRSVAALVSAVTADASTREPDDVVKGCFVDVQHPRVSATLSDLPDDASAVVVPLLLSAGYHVHVDLAEAARDARPRSVAVTRALGPDDRITDILVTRLKEAGLRSGDTVVMAAAGSSNRSAVSDCEAAGQLLAVRLGIPVVVGYLSAARPRLSDAVAAARESSGGGRVVVATYLLAPGYFASLAARSGADVVSAPLLVDDQSPPQQLIDVVIDLYDSVRLVGSPT